MKNDVKNHNKTKDKVEEYVKEKAREYFRKLKRMIHGEFILEGQACLRMLIRQIINDQKPRVSKKFVGKVTARIYCDRKSSEAIKIHVQNAFKEIGVEIEE